MFSTVVSVVTLSGRQSWIEFNLALTGKDDFPLSLRSLTHPLSPVTTEKKWEGKNWDLWMGLN